MNGSRYHLAIAAVLGLFAGLVLGPLLVPDPTSATAGLATAGVAVVTATALYRSLGRNRATSTA